MKHREGAEPWVFYEGPPRPMASPDFITCGPGSTRTSSAATKQCRAATSLVAPVGTPTDCPSRSGGEATGISGKKAIVEQVGVEEFTRLCRESGPHLRREFERLTERIG